MTYFGKQEYRRGFLAKILAFSISFVSHTWIEICWQTNGENQMKKTILLRLGTIEGSCVNSKFSSEVVDFPGNFVL